ncbi:prepronociceptin-like [Salvelinus fontinalis]|uniref:prepronociceptin-like n=1 Tax=Salvelinus fontinalis TaxID=8038 RepID=UPI00248511BF|nr:prepronociceptin-like [Salvelinus fontinalis]XP_055718733.1 prepronociceptin-like [Salvelinus fontinalis]XP_055718734.1 prepronociceptin-like [Salvelinus fontinalis]
MKTPLWSLLLLCLCVPGHCSECQGDCLACGRILPQEINFNTLVCLVECEGNVSPAFTWDMCRKASASPQLPSQSIGGAAMLTRAQKEVEAMLPEEEEEQGEGGLMYPVALQRFDHVVRALGIDELGSESRLTADVYNSQLPQEMQERDEEVGDEEEGDNVMEREQDGAAGISLSKRFGGFLKGRHGYRKLIGPGRPMQKRYGGFIGVRKSARKWNNQKRFSEFLKQYLGMSTRASKSYNSISADITQQNKV